MEDGYHLTSVGCVISSKLYDMIRTMTVLEKSKDFWLTHDVWGIPKEFLDRINELEDMEIVRSTPTDVIKALSYYIKLVRNVKNLEGVSPIMHPDFPKIIERLVDRGATVKLVLTKEIFEMGKKKHSHLFKELINKENFEVWIYEEPIRVAFTVTEEFLSLALFHIDGNFDSNNDLISKNKGAIAFGRNVITFLVSSSLFVALALFSVVYFSFLSLQITPNWPLFLASFLVTFSIYNLNKVTDKKEDMLNSPERLNYVGNRDKLLIILSFVAYGVALAIGVLSGEILVIVVLLIPLWVAIVYSVRLSPNLPRVKDIFVAKSLAVTASLVFSTLLLAYICSRNNFLVLFWGYFLFLKIFINTTLFDVRDVSGFTEFAPHSVGNHIAVSSSIRFCSSVVAILYFLWVLVYSPFLSSRKKVFIFL